jgi:hypothetical protein
MSTVHLIRLVGAWLFLILAVVAAIMVGTGGIPWLANSAAALAVISVAFSLVPEC